MGSTGATSFRFNLYGRSDDLYETPFPLPSNKSEANEIARFNFRLGKYSDIPSVDVADLPVQQIDLSVLSNSQETVNKAAMDSLMRLSASQLQEIKDTSTTSDIPYVIKYGDTYQIQDGHHRLSALKAKGVKTARVRVLDLSRYAR